MAPAILIPLLISGAAMGAQVGLQLLTPRQKQVPIDRGKFDDVRVTGSEYGAFIGRVWGKARGGGNIVWSSGVTETIVNTPAEGGKKATGGATTDHVYTTSLAVLFIRGIVNDFTRIWADTDIVVGNTATHFNSFEAEGVNATLSGGAATFVDATASGGSAVQNLGAGGKVVFTISSVTNPSMPRHDPDEIALSKTRINIYYKTATDKTATVDTSVTSPENITLLATGTDWSVYSYQVDGFSSSFSYEYAAAATANVDRITVEKFWEITPLDPRPSYSITGVVNPNIGYPPNVNDPSEYYNYQPADAKNGTTGTYNLTTSVPSEAIRFYTGTETQTADAAIKAWLDAKYGAGEGVLRASAMRGLAYVLFENYTIKGGRVPNFVCELSANSADVNSVLADLFEDVGLTTGDYDLTATAGLTQIGVVESTAGSRKSFIEALERYHFFRLAEIDGKIYSIVDSGTSIATLDANKLRAHKDSEEMPAFDAEVVVREEMLLPREVRVSIMNPLLEYHNETASAMVFASTVGTESKQYTFPIVDTIANARTVAEKLILKEYAENTPYEFYAMPEYAKYSPGDVITVPINGTNQVMRIERKTMELPIGKVRFSCISTGYIYSGVVFQDDATAFAPKAELQYAQQTFPRNTVIFPIISEPIYDGDRGRKGVYLAMCGRGKGAGAGFGLYREYAADNYLLHETFTTPSPLGITTAALATVANTSVEDTTNTLDIWFFDEVSLESVTQPDINRYATINLIRVGSEWIQFRTATVQTLESNSPYRSKWRISNLWRGRFGTTAAVSTHVSGEYAAVVTSALYYYDLNAEDVKAVSNEDITLKAVTNGQDLAVAPACTFAFTPLSAYTVTNGAADRTFNADATSINELADVVATVISDLKL